MKTAVQIIANEIVDDNLGENKLNFTMDQITKVIGILHKHLETEKQQIIEAHNKGQNVYSDVIYNDKSKNYYNETFEKK